jgi:ubiquinone/menaquinone biosynthesis C-methylase UbiE
MVLEAVRKAYDATWGRYAFAGLYDRFLSRSEAAGLSQKRREMLLPARGRTLELGAGTGLNLPHYPDAVTELVVTEPYPHMVPKLRDKMDALQVDRRGRRTQLVVAEAERLPFEDESFDTVAAAMILCTVKDPEVVLVEIERVLKPDGQYLFLEHVRNPDKKIALKQDLIQPGWFLFGNECHCNRPTVETIGRSRLNITHLKRDKIPAARQFIEAMVIGRAEPVPHSAITTGGLGVAV